MLNMVETDRREADPRTRRIRPNDIDAAIEELDARYLAAKRHHIGLASSVIAAGYAALNRYESRHRQDT